MKPYTSFIIVITGVLLLNCRRAKPPRENSIHWLYSIDSALVLAHQSTKPIMIDFMAEWCPPCKAMEDSTFNQAEIIVKSGEFIPVRIDVDKQPDIAVAYNGNARKYGGVGIPNLLFLTPSNEIIKHVIGYQSADKLLAVMDSVLTVFSMAQ